MSRLISLGTIAGSLLALATVAGCDSSTSATDLNPAGPPMVRQILMTEVYTNNSTPPVYLTRDNSLAFGTHPDPTFDTDDKKVDTALAGPGQKIRVIVDELLVGNYLEEIACKGQVDDDAYSAVPLGTTPADIANCAGTQDILDARCKGAHAVCLNETGAPIPGVGTAPPIPVGGPVGILDGVPEPDGDGVPDNTRFIDGVAKVSCMGKAGVIEAPMDLTTSYWQPSGNQQVPANGGVGVLGPALVLVPRFGLPTAARCSITFDPSVVDHDGNRLCAPPDGDVTKACPSDGDTSLINFGTETLRFKGNQPVDNAMNVQRLTPGSLNMYGRFYLDFNVLMSIPSLMANVSITANGVPVTTGYSIVQETASTKYDFRFPAPGFAAATTYVVTVPKTLVTDYFGQPYDGDPVTFTFTTGN
jgi:hypothetical protein